MARIRTVKPEFWTSEQVMECSPIARLMFIGLWNFADDAGRMAFSAKRIKAQLFPSDDITSEDVRRMVDELQNSGLVGIYDVEGQTYLHVTGWHHQKIDKPQKSKLPPPPDDYSPNGRRTFGVGMEGIGRDRKGREESEPSSSTEVASASAQADPPAAVPKIDFQTVSDACHAALPADVAWRVKTSEDIAPIIALIRDGADLALDVVPAIRTRSEQTKAEGGSVTSWRYFVGAVQDRAKSRKAAQAAGPALATVKRFDPATAPDAERRHHAVAQHYAENRRDWTAEWGPAPGREGCKVPAHILAEHGIDPKTGSLVRAKRSSASTNQIHGEAT